MRPLADGDPARVGEFVLRGRLGAGGMGEVFYGRSPGGRAVAVKVVHRQLAAQTEFRRRFRREVAAARAVSGAFTAAVLGAGPEDDPPWIATAYVAGPTLTDAVTEAGPLPEDALWPLAAGLVEALRAIHAANLLHRDLKPSNVLLAPDGPRVIDFGISRALDGTSLTDAGVLAGTPGYMAPEQIEHEDVGPAADVFALGAVLAYAATGEQPFGLGPPLAVLHRVVSAEPRLGTLADPVRALVTECLDKDPDRRPTPAHLLTRIASHWDPPGDVPSAPAWPSAVTALLTRRMSDTAPYTVEEPPVLPPNTPPPPSRPPPYHPPPPPGAAADPQDTARLLAETAAERARTLGPAHPDTLAARHHHALHVGSTRSHGEAALYLAEIAAEYERILGRWHPVTLAARHDHGLHLGKAGAQGEAVRILREVADLRSRVLGPDHLDTLASWHLYADNLGELGQHGPAVGPMAMVADRRTRVLGPDHPDTLAARHNHAYHLGLSGHWQNAAALLVPITEAYARVMGPDHRDTLSARHNHAIFLWRCGFPDAARRIFVEIDAARLRARQSAQHPTWWRDVLPPW